MKNQYEYTINSTEDISRALAEREGYVLTYYNSAFYLPAPGVGGSRAQVLLEGDAKIIRGVDVSVGLAN